MKIQLTEQEMQNIVASLSQENIKIYHNGDYIKWTITKNEDGYLLDYRFDEQGNLKQKLKGEGK